ncbi:MAG TPA: hypothetical protein VH479_09355 [Acidimicrobiales bacterium]
MVAIPQPDGEHEYGEREYGVHEEHEEHEADDGVLVAGVIDPGVEGPTQVVVGRRAQRVGVVVPLRVPLRTRLKAGAGLFVLVVMLGTATALLVAGLALAGAQALGAL